MENRLPNISNKHKICVICEGNEEYQYLERLKRLNVWNDIYDITLENAGGNGNIPARYQDKYQNGSFEMIFIFCDTEKKPYEQYEDIKRKINEFHGVEHAAEEVIVFANPCTLQIVAKHWTDETIKSPAKPVNAPLIEKYTGVKNYKAREDQICQIMEKLDANNYEIMKNRVKMLDSEDCQLGSSNFASVLDLLESEDCRWIEEKNGRL